MAKIMKVSVKWNLEHWKVFTEQFYHRLKIVSKNWSLAMWIKIYKAMFKKSLSKKLLRSKKLTRMFVMRMIEGLYSRTKWSVKRFRGFWSHVSLMSIEWNWEYAIKNI